MSDEIKRAAEEVARKFPKTMAALADSERQDLIEENARLRATIARVRSLVSPESMFTDVTKASIRAALDNN